MDVYKGQQTWIIILPLPLLCLCECSHLLTLLHTHYGTVVTKGVRTGSAMHISYHQCCAAKATCALYAKNPTLLGTHIAGMKARQGNEGKTGKRERQRERERERETERETEEILNWDPE